MPEMRYESWRFHSRHSHKTGPCQRRVCLMCLAYRLLDWLP